jgi:ribosomal protein S11
MNKNTSNEKLETKKENQMKKSTKKSAVKKSIKKVAVAFRAAAPKKVSVSSFMRQLIREGRTNEQIFEVAKIKFNLPDSKKSYPGWYRAEMIRNGKAA